MTVTTTPSTPVGGGRADSVLREREGGGRGGGEWREEGEGEKEGGE